MEETKKWWQSKTIWGAAIVLAVAVLRILGNVTQAETIETEKENILAWLEQAAIIIGGALAFIGRLTAKKMIS